jgi:PhzF family phenazine biosynthesis protein
MKIPVYYVDAFTKKLFSGNPAAVIFSNDVDDEYLMQNIAAENNLSETAFIRKEKNAFHIRWFAPSCEIDLCGHATLASAYIYFKYIEPSSSSFRVESKKNGTLRVFKKNELLFLDFPKDNIVKDEIKDLDKIINKKILEVFRGRDDFLAIVNSEEDVAELNINFEKLKKLPARGLIVSAEGKNCDFVSRCFFSATGVDEDPVTGSAHTTLTPYWSNKLNKTKLNAKQISQRGGELLCQIKEDRVFIGGDAVEYMSGHIEFKKNT